MKKDRNNIVTMMVLCVICGSLIGFIGGSLHWKAQAEKEISRILSGKFFVDPKGRVFSVSKK
jgi:hypothetical protein